MLAFRLGLLDVIFSLMHLLFLSVCTSKKQQTLVAKLTHFKARNRNRVSDIHTCQTASHHLVCVIIRVLLRLFPQVLSFWSGF